MLEPRNDEEEEALRKRRELFVFYLGMQILPPGQDSDEDCKYDRCSLSLFFLK
jgi:hypothetical protein